MKISDKRFDCYEKQQAELLDFIEVCGGEMTQQQFDAEFANFRNIESIRHDGTRILTPNVGRFFPLSFLSDDAPLLGGIQGGAWAKWLDLLQWMVGFGIVEVSGDVPNVVYRAKVAV